MIPFLIDVDTSIDRTKYNTYGKKYETGISTCLLLCLAGVYIFCKKQYGNQFRYLLLTGHIERYKPAAEPLIGKIYYEELFTGKPLVKVTEVALGGYFQASIPLGHSQEMNLNVGSRYYTLYALPKGKLHLTLNPAPIVANIKVTVRIYPKN